MSADRYTRAAAVIVDAMAEIQILSKPEWIKHCSDLADQFSDHILTKYNATEYEDVHLIFDRYDIPLSLKTF